MIIEESNFPELISLEMIFLMKSDAELSGIDIKILYKILSI